MIHKLACQLAILSMEYDKDGLADKETYIYGYEVLLGKVVTYFILFVIGIAVDLLAEMIIFILFLTSLKGQTGGFHLKTYYGCIICSVIISFVSILIANNMQPEFALTVLPIFLILSSICIIVYSPINHPNLNLTVQEADKCKKLSKSFLLGQLIVVTLLLLLHVKPSIIISACLAIISVAISIIIAKIKKQEVPYYE